MSDFLENWLMQIELHLPLLCRALTNFLNFDRLCTLSCILAQSVFAKIFPLIHVSFVLHNHWCTYICTDIRCLWLNVCPPWGIVVIAGCSEFQMPLSVSQSNHPTLSLNMVGKWVMHGESLHVCTGESGEHTKVELRNGLGSVRTKGSIFLAFRKKSAL